MVNKESDAGELKRMEQLKALERSQRMTIPPDGVFSNVWDILMLIALFYTAVVMPAEIGFIPTNDALKLSNNIFDIFFFFDIGVSMHLAVFDESQGRNIRDTCVIRKRYIKSWFAIDLISTFPFDQLSSMKAIRIIKVLKLLRLFRIGRIFTRWQPVIGFRYTLLTLSACLIGGITLAHWGACGWGVVAQFGDDGESWIDAYGIQDSSPAYQYICALYWSTMTLTTIGYGDYGPGTGTERFVASFFCMLGGLVYAYLVGIITGTMLELKHAQLEYIRMRDMLNRYMHDTSLPKEVRKEARLYFRENRGRYRIEDQKVALGQLSPGLEGKLIEYSRSRWLARMKIAEKCPKNIKKKEYDCEVDRFRKCLVHQLSVDSFPRKEALIVSGALASKIYVVKRGILAKSGQLIGRYDVVGEDVILFLIQPNARRPYRVMTLTFVDLYSLHKDDIKAALDNGEFPNVRKSMRKTAIKLALRLAFIKRGRELLLQKAALKNRESRENRREKKESERASAAHNTAPLSDDEGRLSTDDRFSSDGRFSLSSFSLGRVSLCAPELRGFPAYSNKDPGDASYTWAHEASYAVIGKQLDRLLTLLNRIEVICDKNVDIRGAT